MIDILLTYELTFQTLMYILMLWFFYRQNIKKFITFTSTTTEEMVDDLTRKQDIINSSILLQR